MKRILIIISLSILSVTISSAQYFSKHYVPTGYWGVSIDKFSDTSYVIVTLANLNSTKIGYLKINDTGKIINFKSYAKDSISSISVGWSNNYAVTTNSSIVFGATYQDTSGNQKPYIVKFKSNGDTAWMKVLYQDSGYVLILQTRSTADGGFLLLGERKLVLTNDASLILIKVDSNGVEHWHKIYDTPLLEDYVCNFQKLTDDSFLISESIFNSAVTYEIGKVFCIDSLGNILWTNLYNGVKEKNAGGRACGASHPNEYYFVGFGYDTTNVYQGHVSGYYPPYFEKVNTNGNVVWRKFIETQFETFDLPAIIKEINGNLYVLGFSYDTSLNNNHTVAIFAKFDSLGNIKWTQRYFKSTAVYNDNYLSDFVPTKDGGFMLCGSSWDTLNNANIQCTWIVRVDSNGCQMANCMVKDTVGSGMASLNANYSALSIYPNPCDNKLSVLGHQFTVNTKVEVFDLLGRKIELPISFLTTDNCQLTTENLPSGIYFLKATDINGKVSNAKFVKE